MSINPIRFSLLPPLLVGSAIGFESSPLRVERSSDEARKFQRHKPHSAGPERDKIAVSPIRSASGDFSKPSAAQLSHSFRNRRLHLSLSGDRPTRFREN